jgi:hypothetical protein
MVPPPPSPKPAAGLTDPVSPPKPVACALISQTTGPPILPPVPRDLPAPSTEPGRDWSADASMRAYIVCDLPSG